jgi:lysozyme
MSSEEREKLRQQLVEHEGERLTVYRCPAGYLTIGVGRNLEGTGISKAESRHLLDNDINRCINEAVARFPWFPDMDPIRQRAIVDLVFNMGMGTFLTFRRTLSYLAVKDYEQAGNALVNSQWYRQVGRRGKRIVSMVRLGIDPGLETT